MPVSSRQRRGKPQQRRAPRQRAPMTEVQRAREHLLIDLGVTKSDIARALKLPLYRITNVFSDRNRSLGPEGVEQRVIDHLRQVARGHSRVEIPAAITRESMGWMEPVIVATTEPSDGIYTAGTYEMPAGEDESQAGKS